ncbi:MAG TPA: AbrB/MazE/SpoVT family DNA-binding domain-containing protein, partial [Syntrophales bacterium]|nr:AbrB/MazE/SpoVT family DNA-binding domain-containing protein [Syntrophales bacterium]
KGGPMQRSIITVSGRGQIVIPRQIRNHLNIKPGRKLTIKVEGDSAVMTPLPDDPVGHFCGIFREGPSLTEALLDQRRKDRRDEDEKSA